MRSFQKTYAFALVIFALAAFTVYDYRHSVETEAKKKQDSLLVQIKDDQLAAFSLKSADGTTIRLENKAGKWMMLEPIQDSADSQALANLFATMSYEKSTEVVAEGADIGWAIYGLDKPLAEFNFTSTTGKVEKLAIGHVKAYDGSYYARVDNENKVLLVPSTWGPYSAKTVKDLRDKVLYRGAPDQKFSWIRIQRTDKGDAKAGKDVTPVIELKLEDKTWKMVKGGDGTTPVGSEQVSQYLSAVTALHAADFLIEDGANKTNIEKYGLNRPEMTIELGDDKSGEKNGKPLYSIRMAPSQDSGTSFPTTSTYLAPIVSLYKGEVETVRKNPEDFYDKKVPFRFILAEAKKIQIEMPKLNPPLKAELVKKDAGWALSDDKMNQGLAKGVDSQKVNELLGKIEDLQADRFFSTHDKSQDTKSGSIRVYKDSGEVLYAMSWGDVLAQDKPKPTPPPASGKKRSRNAAESPGIDIVPVKSSVYSRMVGVPETSLRGLGLETLIKRE